MEDWGDNTRSLVLADSLQRPTNDRRSSRRKTQQQQQQDIEYLCETCEEAVYRNPLPGRFQEDQILLWERSFRDLKLTAEICIICEDILAYILNPLPLTVPANDQL